MKTLNKFVVRFNDTSLFGVKLVFAKNMLEAITAYLAFQDQFSFCEDTESDRTYSIATFDPIVHNPSLLEDPENHVIASEYLKPTLDELESTYIKMMTDTPDEGYPADLTLDQLKEVIDHFIEQATNLSE